MGVCECGWIISLYKWLLIGILCISLVPYSTIVCYIGCYSLPMSYKHTLDVQSNFIPFLQNGWTALFCATQNGHTHLVRLLCEVYGADILHREKVRAMHSTSVIGCLGQLNCVCVWGGGWVCVCGCGCVWVCVCVCVWVGGWVCGCEWVRGWVRIWHACMPVMQFK